MRTRGERTGQLAVDIEQPDMAVGHLTRVDAPMSKTSKKIRVRELPDELRVDLEASVQVESLDAHVDRTLPVELAHRRTDDLGEALVAVDHRHFARAGLDQREQPFDLRAFGLDQIVGEAVFEHRLGQVETLYAVASPQPVEAVCARFEKTDEVPVPEQESAFVLQHDEFLNKHHGLPSFLASSLQCPRHEIRRPFGRAVFRSGQNAPAPATPSRTDGADVSDVTRAVAVLSP